MSYFSENEGYITASKLKVFRKYGPEAFKVHYIDYLVPEYHSEAMDLGIAMEELLTIGMDEWEKQYEILPPGKNRNKKREDKVELTDSTGDKLLNGLKAAQLHPAADLNGKYEFQKEFIHDFKGLKLRTKIDRYQAGLIRDWKFSGDIDGYKSFSGLLYEAILQQAFYAYVVYKSTGEMCNISLDILSHQGDYANIDEDPETKEPQGMNFDSISQYFPTVEDALEGLAECYRTGDFTNKKYYCYLKTPYNLLCKSAIKKKVIFN